MKLVDFVVAACRENPNINFEVFVHKTEKLAEDDKIGKSSLLLAVPFVADALRVESFRQIQERVTDRLADMAPDLEPDILNFHLTSVFDHTLYEAFSRVLHKLIVSLPYLEELLNVFCAVRRPRVSNTTIPID